ncbi:tetratricopeptide repeat protein [Thermotoga caldifontis]|uniref:tetratricopeptide repeat protein n=1 Tax=Thermotoga caldifontis TaxID=1508419 RepID=UPI000B118998|nr:tetratricopeptide repeat protein [Thermotoga caldifontis]
MRAKRLFLAIVFLTASVLAATMEDLEKSWSDLIRRIVREPDSDQVMEIGRKLSAQRRLAEFEPVREAVLREDLEGFIRRLSETEQVREDLLDECFVLFPKLKEDVMNFERGDFSKLSIVSALWKLGYKPNVPENFASWLVRSFLNDPLLLEWNLVFLLRNSANRQEIASNIRQECERMKDREEYYPALYRLMVLAEQLDGVRSQFQSELSKYIELMTSLERFSASQISEEDYRRFSRLFNELSLKKDNLKLLLDQIARRSNIDVAAKRPILWFEKVQPRPVLLISIFLCALVLFFMPRKLKIKLFAFLRAYRLAIKLCRKELEKNPTDVNLRTQLAMLYERIGENEKALQEYRLIRDLSRMIKKDRILPRA